MATAPVAARFTLLPPAVTVKAEPAGTDIVSSASLKERLSAAPSAITMAERSVGGPLRLKAVAAGKLSTSLLSAVSSRSGLVAGFS